MGKSPQWPWPSGSFQPCKSKADTSSFLSLNRDKEHRTMALALLRMPSSPCMVAAPWPRAGLTNLAPRVHPPGALHSLGMGAPFRGCYLSPTVQMTWAFLLHLLQHAEAKKDRTERKYKKGVTFFGEKSLLFLGLRQKEPLFTSPTGTGCWVPLARQNFQQLCLVIGQAPEGLPRKNPVRGRIGRQKLDGKGIGNYTK